jgi:hypothetical protein
LQFSCRFPGVPGSFHGFPGTSTGLPPCVLTLSGPQGWLPQTSLGLSQNGSSCYFS